MLNPLSTIHAVPGPSRQFTATSRGNATGTVGVALAVGNDVADGCSVGVVVLVDRDCVAEGVIRTNVGVSVAGTFDGKLQADITRTRAIMNNRLRNFIAFLLFFAHIILCGNLEDGNGPEDSTKKSLMSRRHQGFRCHVASAPAYFMAG
jgi:hypothetical protein